MEKKDAVKVNGDRDCPSVTNLALAFCLTSCFVLFFVVKKKIMRV